MDATDSMEIWWNRATNQFIQIIEKICNESNNLYDIRVSVIGFRDIGDVERFSVLPFTSNIQEVKDFISKVKT